MDAGSREHIKVHLTAARKALAEAFASVSPGGFAESKIDSAQAGIDVALEELVEPGEPTVTELSTEIHNWANATFPDRPTHSAWVKMFEEIGEVIKDPDDPLEWADVLILFLDLAKIHKIDIAGAVREKIKVNLARKWGVDSRGLMSHIAESEPPTPRYKSRERRCPNCPGYVMLGGPDIAYCSSCGGLMP